MALTGKTIGQLTYLPEINNNTLIPVESSGNTYHVFYSAFTSSNYTELTYDELYSLYTGLSLIPGHFYLISDFQTCYDQPNYDSTGSPITTGNFKSGNTEPLVVLAISNNNLSPQAFSPSYPNDSIKYDITFNFTEVTNTPAKGRITERIDNRNNRTDYDFRAVQFIRYRSFFCEQYLNGTISIDGSGNVTGVDTDFINYFSVGSVLGVKNTYSNIGGFQFYEVTNVIDSTTMTVSGASYNSISNTFYSIGVSSATRSPFQCNMTSPDYTGFTEYYTFDFDNDNYFNNYLGNNNDFDTFILSNNVFLNGPYINNTFGGNVVGNTFDDDMDSNTCGPYFQYNIITNDFDDNTIAGNFRYNFIDPDMQGNNIGYSFQYNMFGDYDGFDFDFNTIGSDFENNFLTFANGSFSKNIIGSFFYENVIDNNFESNEITSDFRNNIIKNNFNYNTIGSDFYGNTMNQSFNNNVIGENFYNNTFYGEFVRNSVKTNVFGNICYHDLRDNSFGSDFFNNIIGDLNNIQNFFFTNNSIGDYFTNNTITGSAQSNTIQHYFTYNTLGANFSYNQIGSNFTNNNIASDFGYGGSTYRGNIIGNGFASNTIGEYFYDNTVGDQFYNNTISDYFINNRISYGMSNTTIVDLDNNFNCQNNDFNTGYFSYNLTISGGTGGNPILYSETNTNIVKDNVGGLYVTFLSGGTIVAQTITTP
jgi:hypothetical protein